MTDDPSFGELVNKALEEQFPFEHEHQLKFELDFTRLNRNTFKITIDMNGQTSTSNFRIEEGKTISIPITVNLN